MPVTTTTTITAQIKCNDEDGTVLFVEAVSWVNNLFRLIKVTYWTFTMDWVPIQKSVDHRRITSDEREMYLKAIVDEWNLYSSKKKNLADCRLIMDTPNES